MDNHTSSSKFDLAQKDLLNKKNTFWSHFSRFKILFKILLILICCFILIHFLRPVLVLDRATYLPISDASVKFEYVGKYWGSGCSEEKVLKTNFLGLVFFPRLFAPCNVMVSKDGYHPNSAELSFFRFRKAKLKKVQNPQPLINYDLDSSFNTCIDILSLVNDENNNSEPNNGDNCDFTFSALSPQYTEVMIGGTPTPIEVLSNSLPAYKIIINGDGGIQEVSKDSPSKSYYFHNDVENMFIAPEFGYKKEMDIYRGKAYVVKLRDGKHYMTLHASISGYPDKDFSIGGYIQPNESRNLEFVGIGGGY